MNRNVNDYFSKTPTPHFPRSRFDMGIHKRLQTQGHGRLTPFFCRIVYPGDTWQMDMSTFVRADTSLRVPLDDIYLDTYFFFVPFRILDKNFAKVLGEVEPYDQTQYSFPKLNLGADYSHTYSLYSQDNILSYLGYNIDTPYTPTSLPNADNPYGYYFQTGYTLSLNPYPLAGYYKIWNDWFRDENLDPTIPVEDLLAGNVTDTSLSSLFYTEFDDSNNVTYKVFNDCLYVNKFHDYFTSAMISPQKGPSVTIPLGTSAPVGLTATGTGTLSSNHPIGFASGSSFTVGNFLQAKDVSGGVAIASDNLIYTDLSEAAGTINQLRLAFAIQALYERRGRYGTRYIETIRGQWGIEVPDAFFERPEYLGGSRVTLNNVPVLSTENSNQLGQMSGNSSTLAGGNSWTKTFIEYGMIIGLSVTRVKHSYCQGVSPELFSLKTGLDLYNPVFANIGYMPILNQEIYNQSTAPGYLSNEQVFAYQEAWAYLRTQTDSFSGFFGSTSANTELKNKWHYGDYYDSLPTFSADWLKEDPSNVTRTLTGNLIPGAVNANGHQYMFGYYFHPVVTRILPSHSIPVELIGRL